VLTWPEVNPASGIMETSLVLRDGGVFYYAEMIDQGRGFDEQQKDSTAGIFFEISVNGSLRGSSTSNILSVQSMLNHEWILIVADRNGVTRLIGNEDTGASLAYKYDSGTVTNSRKTDLSFKWQHPLPAPVYDANAFDIIIGGVVVTAGQLTMLLRFKVGAPGAPMNHGDTLLVNEGLKNKRLLILADGMGIPIDDFSGDIDWSGSIDRHAEKALSSNTINFIGAVNLDETIEIYAFS
jgi:hypothetical protein